MKKVNNFMVAGVVLVLVAVITLGLYFLMQNEGEKNNDPNSSASPAVQDLVESYIRDNISDLSSEKEVLGGTFYVTSVRFTEPYTAVVEYEDGHTALVAETVFSVNEAGQVEIDSFEILGDEQAILPSELNFQKTGNIVQTTEGDWGLVYEEPGKPALTATLVFDTRSLCTDEYENDSCFPEYWEVGDRVEVAGVLEGDILTVSQFRVVGESSKTISGGDGVINSYDTCVSAGYEVFYPDCIDCQSYCETPLGQKFFGSIDSPEICVDKCGDDICQEIVCLGSGCPCAETPTSCPADCAE